jgi:hypothetical protein
MTARDFAAMLLGYAVTSISLAVQDWWNGK